MTYNISLPAMITEIDPSYARMLEASLPDIPSEGIIRAIEQEYANLGFIPFQPLTPQNATIVAAHALQSYNNWFHQYPVETDELLVRKGQKLLDRAAPNGVPTEHLYERWRYALDTVVRRTLEPIDTFHVQHTLEEFIQNIHATPYTIGSSRHYSNGIVYLNPYSDFRHVQATCLAFRQDDPIEAYIAMMALVYAHEFGHALNHIGGTTTITELYSDRLAQEGYPAKYTVSDEKLRSMVTNAWNFHQGERWAEYFGRELITEIGLSTKIATDYRRYCASRNCSRVMDNNTLFFILFFCHIQTTSSDTSDPWITSEISHLLIKGIIPSAYIAHLNPFTKDDVRTMMLMAHNDSAKRKEAV